MLDVRLAGLVFFLANSLALPSPAQPITQVVMDLNQLHKWDNSNGDTWDPFWADDDNLYAFNCDGQGFGSGSRNLALNVLTGPDLPLLEGRRVNGMDDYGKADQKADDGATWKICGQECVDGVFYGFVCRNTYGKDSHDPLMRQTSFNASLIKSTDHGQTWTRGAKENYDQPMWPGGRFGAPGFFHYGKNGGSVTQDHADRFVYALSNNGFWNGGDNFILGRVARADIGKLRTSDWTYFTGGDAESAQAWSGDLTKASPILSLPAKCGWTSACYIPALKRYLLTSWYVTPTLKHWFNPDEVKYDFYQAEHPWGPWTLINSCSDHFLVGGHMYGPSICARYQVAAGDEVRAHLFTSGCPFEGAPAGLYKIWDIPLILQTKPEPPSTLVAHDDPSLHYTGTWQTRSHRLFTDEKEDITNIHFSVTPGDFVEFSFTGSGVDFLADKFRDQGAAAIFLDGQPQGEVGLMTPDFPRLARVAVFSARHLSAGPHSIKVINESGCVNLDGFRVYGAEAGK